MKHELTNGFVERLQELGNYIIDHTDIRDYINNTDDRLNSFDSMKEFPPLSLSDLANIPNQLAFKIKNRAIELDILVLDKIEYFENTLSDCKNMIATAIKDDNPALLQSYLTTMQWLDITVHQGQNWIVTNPDALPLSLTKELTKIRRRIDKLSNESENVEDKVIAINKAFKTANNLPTVQDDLEEALEKVQNSNTVIVNIQKKSQTHLESLSNESAIALDKVRSKLEDIETLKEIAIQLKDECEQYKIKSAQAYQITNTNGLAGAFKERATFLNWSSTAWVIGLILSLFCLWFIGSQQVNHLQELYVLPNITSIAIFLQSVTAILSISAPLWFAWLATTQIHKLFKLSEDYGFKSSVSQSFEGYRKETSDISEDMLKELLASLLKIINDEPLRLVKDDPTSSSPFEQIVDKIRSNKTKHSDKQDIIPNPTTTPVLIPESVPATKSKSEDKDSELSDADTKE